MSVNMTKKTPGKLPKQKQPRRKFIIGAAIVVSTIAGSIGLVACSTAAPPDAMCGYIVGDGTHDRDIHKLVWPGESLSYNSDSEDVRYVPCNARNLIINPDGQTNANGQTVGDWHTPSEGRTSNGTRVKIWSTAYWTLNQNDAALRKFANVCFKYSCFSDGAEGGSTNFSTPGWNGMLAENFVPTINEVAALGALNVTDDVWKTQNVELRQAMASTMSEKFASNMRTKLGNEDLFCGSGESIWEGGEPNEGHSNYTCKNVRFVVDRVEPFDAELQTAIDEAQRSQQSYAQQTENQAQRDAVNSVRTSEAHVLYGDDYQKQLGIQDAIAACRESSVPCVISVGGGNAAPAIPITSAVPAPPTG